MFEIVDEADDYDAGTRPLKYMSLTALGRCLESSLASMSSECSVRACNDYQSINRMMDTELGGF
jgi:hypothetical protein